MELTNYKTYKKEMERIGYDADMTLDMIERWASECDGSYGSRDIHYCDHYHHDFAFDLVRPDIGKFATKPQIVEFVLTNVRIVAI